MENANQILSSFLVYQRAKAHLKTIDVAQHLGYSVEQIELWEKRPVKAPLCEIARLVKLYKTPEIAFSKTIWSVQMELAKGRFH